jgi:hypothetical protein
MTSASTSSSLASASAAPTATGAVSERRLSRTITNPSAPKYGRRYAHAQAKLYLVIHEICGPCFDHADAQRCLSILAASDSLSLFASVESLNIGLLWDPQTVARFRWRYYHCPTYIHHRVPADHPLLISTAIDLNSIGNKNAAHTEAANSGQALVVLLDSLTHNHREFINRFCKALLAKQALMEGNKSVGLVRELPMSVALDMAMNALIVKNKAELRKLLMEFQDHRVFQTIEDGKIEVLRILLSDHDIIRMSSLRLR